MKVRINGSIINYQVYGNSKKKPILILHGWNQSSSIWAQCAQQLSNRGYFVVVPDLPACGQSSPLREPSVGQYCQTLVSLLHKLSLKNPIVIGHSFGGQLAVVLSTYTGVDALVLVAPAIIRTHAGSSRWLLTLLKLVSPISHIVPTSWRYHLSSGTDYAQSTPEQKRVMRHVLTDATAEELLSSISVPTLLVWGEHDHELIGTPKSLVARIPMARLKCIYEAGHNLHLEKPRELMKHIHVFLEGVLC